MAGWVPKFPQVFLNFNHCSWKGAKWFITFLKLKKLIIRRSSNRCQAQPYPVQITIQIPLKYFSHRQPTSFQHSPPDNYKMVCRWTRPVTLQAGPTGPSFSLGALTFPRLYVGLFYKPLALQVWCFTHTTDGQPRGTSYEPYTDEILKVLSMMWAGPRAGLWASL